MSNGFDPRNRFGAHLARRLYLLKPKKVWCPALCDPYNNFGHAVLGPRPPQDVIDSIGPSEYISIV
jgi:hypothetical protein